MLNDVEYIIDPTPVTMRSFLKKNCNIKLSKNIPDHIVSTVSKGFNFIYIVDESLNQKSKFFLDRISNLDKDMFIKLTLNKAKSHFQAISDV